MTYCILIAVIEKYVFMKNNKLVPIFGMEGEIDWMCCMAYRCNSCSAAPVPVVVPRLLAKLPTPLRMKYPVDPRYSRGSFHLHKKTSDWLRRLTLTYGSVRCSPRSCMRCWEEAMLRGLMIMWNKAALRVGLRSTRHFKSGSFFSHQVGPHYRH